MDRKHFFSSIVASAAVVSSLGQPEGNERVNAEKSVVIPPYLKDGDLIGITCPAGSITEMEIASSVRQMQHWGFAVKNGDTIGKKDFTFGGTDEERARDFQQMLDDDAVKAILCARGGYGSIRIIDRLDFLKI